MILFNTKNNRCILIDPSMDDSHADRNVLAIGSQVITPGQPYPPKGFPEGSLFEDSGGRCLDNFQIVYVVKGSGHFNDRGINYMVTPGTLMIIRPGYWHSYAPNPKTGWVEYYVGFTGRLYSKIINDGFPSTSSNIMSVTPVGKLKDIFEKMLSYALKSSDDAQFLMNSFLMLLITEVVHGSKLENANNTSTRIVARARDYMEENLSKKINLERLAEDLCVSYTWFRRAFKEQTGESPVRYLQKIRLQRAKYILMTTNKSVKQVAASCGFSTSEYFCNSFKDECGVTPLEFRETSSRPSMEVWDHTTDGKN